MSTLLLVLGATYVAASINGAIVVLRLAGKGDPRTAHSGNPGTSNVYRVAGPAWAAVVLLFEVGRAVALAWLALRRLPLAHVPLVWLALVLGIRFPLFHGFRGGKGVAGSLGFVALVHPLAAALAAASWVLVFAFARVSFIGSFAMVAVLGAGVVLRCGFGAVPMAATAATVALIYAAHSRNWRGRSAS
jgi:glycerol-3-phosphate acyltransferase PlsY